jgi:hypothetical protein
MVRKMHDSIPNLSADEVRGARPSLLALGKQKHTRCKPNAPRPEVNSAALRHRFGHDQRTLPEVLKANPDRLDRVLQAEVWTAKALDDAEERFLVIVTTNGLDPSQKGYKKSLVKKISRGGARPSRRVQGRRGVHARQLCCGTGSCPGAEGSPRAQLRRPA